jgi:hypothetical protein
VLVFYSVCIFLDLFHDLTGIILSLVGDVTVDSEAPVGLHQSREFVGSIFWMCS